MASVRPSASRVVQGTCIPKGSRKTRARQVAHLTFGSLTNPSRKCFKIQSQPGRSNAGPAPSWKQL